MDQKKKKLNCTTDEWIKCQSKSRRGKLYYFNKTSGETRWTEPENYKDNAEAEKTSTSSSNSPQKKFEGTKTLEIAPTITKNVKNPAQDRLKRLQHKLKVEQKSKDKPKHLEKNNNVENSNEKYDLKTETKTDKTIKDQRSMTNAEASTSQAAIATAKNISSTRKILTGKRKLSTSSIKSTTSSPSKRQILTRRSSIELPTKRSSLELATKVARQPTETISPPRKHTRQTDKYTSHSSSTTRATTTLGSGIATSENVAAASPIDIIKTAATNGSCTPTLDVKAAPKSCNSVSSSSTPKNLVIPTYEKGGANTRLERLRLSLLQQPTSSTMFKTTTSSLCASTSSSALACVIANNDSTNTNEDADEPMDWAPTEPDKNTIEISSNSSSISNTSKFFNLKQSKNSNTFSDNEQKSKSSSDGTIGEYYDRVNENLLRFAAEKQYDAEASPKKWQTDYYYFVVDTNVMLEHSQFIGDVMRMHLCGTTGTIIYIPYCVLQELDKLKIRGRSEGIKTLAIFAIKFLNAHLAAKNKHIQAQSAIEERRHIIDVDSPDDSIINCCLQVKQHLEHVILLTEDINLRNKAMCNNILVSTKSDLTSRHPSSKQTHK